MNSAAEMRLAGGTSAVFQSQAMRTLMATAERVATHDAAVLIVGETGVGKELVAQAIHQHSPRRGKAFIDVNCAAFPEHLVESELFGYEKGAFSGADTTKAGLFELADHGTLFLDEIGELDAKVQAKLLRVLDGVPYYRLGGNSKVTVHVRVIAATNRNLEEEVRNGKFRSDLYHRIAEFQLSVLPLRERLEDIAVIAQYFLRKHLPSANFSPEAIEALQQYSWPGNVRELRNVVLNAALSAKQQTATIQARDLPPSICQVREVVPTTGFSGDLRDMERQMILQALESNGGNQATTAKQLGISTRTLRRKLQKYRRGDGAGSGKTLGRLGHMQRYFRVDIEIPVQLRQEDQEFHGKTVNLSLGGMAIHCDSELSSGSLFEISFAPPGVESPIETKAELAWTSPGGLAGISFVDMHPVVQWELHQWLLKRSHPEATDEKPGAASHHSSQV